MPMITPSEYDTLLHVSRQAPLLRMSRRHLETLLRLELIEPCHGNIQLTVQGQALLTMANKVAA